MNTNAQQALDYITASQEAAQIRQRLIEHLETVWNQYIDPEFVPIDAQWNIWIDRYEPAEIERAIKIAAPRWLSGYLGESYNGLYAYITGILRRRAESRSS